MKDTIAALLSSRKFLVGAITVAAVASATVLRTLEKIPSDALLPTIAGIVTIGVTFIAATAHEDAAAKKSSGLLEDEDEDGSPPTEKADKPKEDDKKEITPPTGTVVPKG